MSGSLTIHHSNTVSGPSHAILRQRKEPVTLCFRLVRRGSAHLCWASKASRFLRRGSGQLATVGDTSTRPISLHVGGSILQHVNFALLVHTTENRQMDMSGWFVPTVDLTSDDDDTNCHLSDIPLQLPASANVSSNNSALVMFSQAEGDFLRNVPSLHPIPSQTGGKSLAVTVSQNVPSGFTSRCWTSRNCSIGYTTST